MGFRNGSVSYARFAVAGGPEAVTTETLDALAGGQFRHSDIGVPPEIQAGWVAGRHIYDLDFAPEVVAFGDVLLFGLRLDTNRIPAQVRLAYRAMAEQARQREHPGRPLDGAGRREAREHAEEQCRQELTSGQHRRSALIPVLWDLPRRVLLAPAFSDARREALEGLMRDTFDAETEPGTAGSLAAATLSAAGRRRDYEDLAPSPFTPPPAALHDEDERPAKIPPVSWSPVGPAPKDFLGNEFILWLLSRTGGSGEIDTPRGPVAVMFDRLLETQCAWDVTGTQTLRAHAPTRLPESNRALQLGKWPRKAGLTLSITGEHWDLTLQGDRFQVTGAKLPPPEDPPAAERELVEDRLGSLLALDGVLCDLFHAFIDRRAAAGWSAERRRLATWLQGGRRGDAGRDEPAPEQRPAAAIEVMPRRAGTADASEPSNGVSVET